MGAAVLLVQHHPTISWAPPARKIVLKDGLGHRRWPPLPGYHDGCSSLCKAQGTSKGHLAMGETKFLKADTCCSPSSPFRGLYINARHISFPDGLLCRCWGSRTVPLNYCEDFGPRHTVSFFCSTAPAIIIQSLRNFPERLSH
jgi:hypothetical protein